MQPVYSHPEVHASPRQSYFRSNLNANDEFLCINILTVTCQSFWYLLARSRDSTNPASNISLPRKPIFTVDSACATFGRNIYVLGGSWNGHPTNTVQIYDAHHGAWEQVQRMRIPRRFASAGMFRGRIHIIGGTSSLEWWAEAFDPMSRVWEVIRIRPFARNHRGIFLITDNGGLMFVGGYGRPSNRYFWCMVKTAVGKMTVLDGVIYMCHRDGYITGYEQATKYRFVVQGLDLSELLPNFLVCSRMTNLRGMLCIVWKDNQMINCIGILVTRGRNQMVSGSIAWRERVPLSTEAVNGELDYCGTLEF